MMESIYKMELIDGTNKSLNELDYLMLASGSDTRAYEVLSKCKSLEKKRVIVFNFNERLKELTATDPLFKYQTFTYNSLQEIACEIKSPSSCLEEIVKNSFSISSKIGIDISCLTKPYFYFIIKLLKERFKVEKLSVFYTEPKSYLFPKGLFKAFHTSSGPLTILEIPGYSGHESRGAKRKLVILLGFDGDLSKEINEDVSPNDTIVVNGFPSYTPKFKDISLIANEKLVSDRNINVAYARANNPFEIYNLLHQIKEDEDPNTFINVAPLGTKPMALGACLFALHNPEVRIVYPLPEIYENKYSDKSWSSWIYDLPLIN
ncbi:MAG: hypothetical protein ACTHK8_20810 [Ginsengibacter sp.]